MKKLFVLILILCLMLIASPVFASHGVYKEGTRKGAATDVNYKGQVEIDNFGSTAVIKLQSPVVVEASTPDTITTSEGGTTFVATSAAQGGKSFDLPAVTSSDNGLWYRFVTGSPSVDASSVHIPLNINPQSDSQIFWDSNNGDGVSIQSSSISADCYPTIELVAYNGDWYVVNMTGTWEQGS